METVANWGARPVFITSTFQDMQAERDWLWDFVPPPSRNGCAVTAATWNGSTSASAPARGKAETEAEREAQVLKVCLDEVRRSRPFLIALIGDRYGWVPPHDRAEAAAEKPGSWATSRPQRHRPGDRFRRLPRPRPAPPHLVLPARSAALRRDGRDTPPASQTRTTPTTRRCRPRRSAGGLKARMAANSSANFTAIRRLGRGSRRVTGLEEFGEQVEAAIRAQLEAELAEAAAPPNSPGRSRRRARSMSSLPTEGRLPGPHRAAGRHRGVSRLAGAGRRGLGALPDRPARHRQERGVRRTADVYRDTHSCVGPRRRRQPARALGGRHAAPLDRRNSPLPERAVELADNADAETVD